MLEVRIRDEKSEHKRIVGYAQGIEINQYELLLLDKVSWEKIETVSLPPYPHGNYKLSVNLTFDCNN